MDDLYGFISARMVPWHAGEDWLSPPVWPVVEAVALPAPREEIYKYHTLNQVEHGNQSQAINNTLHQQWAHQETAVEQCQEVINTLQRVQRQQLAHQNSLRHSQWQQTSATAQYQTAVQQTRNHSHGEGITLPEGGGFSANQSRESHQTTVTISPTIHLQATVYEQANVEDLVARLGRLLEQEIAISAERAYS